MKQVITNDNKIGFAIKENKDFVTVQFRNNQIKRYPAGEVDTFKPSILPPGMGMSDKQLQNLIYKWKKRAEEFRGPAKDVALMILKDLQP